MICILKMEYNSYSHAPMPLSSYNITFHFEKINFILNYYDLFLTYSLARPLSPAVLFFFCFSLVSPRAILWRHQKPNDVDEYERVSVHRLRHAMVEMNLVSREKKEAKLMRKKWAHTRYVHVVDDFNLMCFFFKIYIFDVRNLVILCCSFTVKIGEKSSTKFHL